MESPKAEKRTTRAVGTGRQLQVVLETYALMLYDRQAHDSSPPALHRSAHVDHAHYYLEAFISDLIRAEVQNRTAEVSMNPADLARYCIYAMDAASSLSSRDAVPVLVDVTVQRIYH